MDGTRSKKMSISKLKAEKLQQVKEVGTRRRIDKSRCLPRCRRWTGQISSGTILIQNEQELFARNFKL